MPKMPTMKNDANAIKKFTEIKFSKLGLWLFVFQSQAPQDEAVVVKKKNADRMPKNKYIGNALMFDIFFSN